MESGSSATSIIFLIIVIIIIGIYSSVTGTEINYPVVAYTLAVIIFMMTTLSSLYRSERLITAIFTFITFLLIFILFGLRWFKHDMLNNTNEHRGSFPPVINTCPDYLSMIRRTNGNNACIDTLGVSTNPNILLRWTSDLTAATATSDSYYFSHLYQVGATNMDFLKAKAVEAGLSWEGITDDSYTVAT